MSDSMSAIEYENMEQKYIETKSKLKKTLQYNERYTIQIQKLNKRLKRLENENKQLENQVDQLRATARDTSESDVSTPTNLHQERAGMVDLVHSKNQQISDLLKDIEVVENENMALKDKLAEAKDQLAAATNEIAAVTETLKLDEIRSHEQEEMIKNMTSEIEHLKEELDLAEKEKGTLEGQVNLLSNEVKERESQWKAIWEEKEKTLQELKSYLRQNTTEANPTNLKNDDEESHKREVNTLKATLSETEARLYELKSEMENCTVELKGSAKLIKQLKTENQQIEKKLEEMKESENDMKEQLKKAHDRCQNMQREVEYANKMTKMFEDDLTNLKEKLKQNGHADTVASLEEIERLKIENLLHEKQIVGLVKDINKLQELCNIFEIENNFLRQQLGLTSQDTIDIDPRFHNESKKQKKLIEKLRSDNRHFEEEKIRFKLEIKNLKHQITTLMSDSNIPQNRSGSNNNYSGLSSKLLDDRSGDIKTLSEENEALRKGLHEILNSIQIKNETSPREIKSDILERLLKALDAKHISGWYHPAMRLQAELHTLEGVNSELREQLHEARMELDELKSTNPTPRGDPVNVIDRAVRNVEDEINEKRDSVLVHALSSDIDKLEKIKVNVMKIFVCLSDGEESVESKLQNEIEYLKHHLDLLHANCNSEKERLLENLKSIEDSILDLESPEITAKTTTEALIEQIKIERKKANYTFKRMIKLQEEMAALKRQSDVSYKNHLFEIETLLKTITVLSTKLHSKEKQSLNVITHEAYKQMENMLNENIKKYRKLLSEVEERQKERSLELDILAQKEVDLAKENNELKDKIKKVLVKLSQDIYKQDENVLPLSQQLANAEVQALSEKHRADHTNNLYELVKEQLKKSEEKFIEFSKYGDGLIQKNLALQERIVELEDQLTLCVEPELFKELQGNLNKLIRENEKLHKENEELIKNHEKCVDAQQQSTSWSNEKEQELLGLKHEIIDLTTLSDDKAVVDQLYRDQIKLRSELRECQMQVDFLKREVSIWESRYGKVCCEMDEQRNFFEMERRAYDKKIGVLQSILIQQKIQYHGCVPMTIQELLVEKMQSIRKDRHEAFISLLNVKVLEKELENSGQMGKAKQLTQKGENYDPKNHQIEYLKRKLANQEKNIEKLERELFSAYQHGNNSAPVGNVTKNKTPALVRELVCQESIDPTETKRESSPDSKGRNRLTILRNIESQTEEQRNEEKEDVQLTMIKIQLKNLQNQLSVKKNLIAERESSISIMEKLIAERDKELVDIKAKLSEKECQIATLESSLRNIEEHRKARVQPHHDGAAGDGADLRSNFLDEQIMALKVSLKTAQDRLKQKDVEIIKYQTLLKEDRDKHSLAATNLQKELLALRKSLATEQEKTKRLQEELTICRQKSVVVEKYVSQVRALEKHLAELHTQLAQLEAQLQNSHQEATRWRQLAQDRLLAMQELGKSLNEQHNKELSNYKTDYEKLKELSEEESSKKAVPEYKGLGRIDPDILKLCREKDDTILELTSKLKQIESGETLKKSETLLVTEKSGLTKEHEILRGKYENLVSREKSLKDEIRDLKEQLSKRSNLSVRSQRSDRTMKDQMQKRIISLEKEIDELNDKLAQQQLINEKHKLTAHEDFEKWKKQKYWQENCEKYKNKLQEKEEETQKLQQTCIGYKMLIERLEREKINLENRIKNLKSDQRNLISDHEKALLKEENTRLACELATLQAKMEMRQQGSGALGAALMQEKLEAQERKIAVLELSAKGTVEVRNELERLQANVSNLQKKNLCLEAENLELKMDMEKYSNETPHLQEQIQHLESYIEILKEENQKQATSTDANNIAHMAETSEDKKVSQLERTVFILKRVVEKLQAENKRLLSGKRPFPERSASADKLRRDFVRLKEQHIGCLQKIKELESQLQTSRKVLKQPEIERTDRLRSELIQVKEQLLQKTQLLDKVKALLHTAAAREKQLLKEVAELKGSANPDDNDQHINIPSPIEEVSEISSDTGE